MDVSLIGTGLMGHPMAVRLLAAGHRLSVYNRTREKALSLRDQGAEVAASPAAAIVASPVTVLMLKHAPAIRNLLYRGGALPELSGRTILQMSTIGPRESIALMEEVRDAGGEYCEAPVLGSRPQAREGRLLIMVGATAEEFERWSGLLRCFGPEPRRVGEVGQAAALKLAFNQLIAGLASAFALSLGMVRRQGIDVELFMEILRESALHARMFDAKLPRMLARDFSDPNFPARLLAKDLDLVCAEAQALGLGAEPLEGVRAVLERTLAMGLGDGDYCGLYAAVDPA